MSKKTIIVALAVLLLASAVTFVGVYFGVGRGKTASERWFSKAAVAADAGRCSEIGRYSKIFPQDISEGTEADLL